MAHSSTSMFTYVGNGPELKHTENQVVCPSATAGLLLAELIVRRASYYSTISVDVPRNHPTALVFGEPVGRTAMGNMQYDTLMSGIADPEPVYQKLSDFNAAFFGSIAAKPYYERLRTGKVAQGFVHTLTPDAGAKIALTWQLTDVVDSPDGLDTAEKPFVGGGIFDLGYVGLRMVPVCAVRIAAHNA